MGTILIKDLLHSAYVEYEYTLKRVSVSAVGEVRCTKSVGGSVDRVFEAAFTRHDRFSMDLIMP